MTITKFRLFNKREKQMVEWEELKTSWYALEVLETKEDKNYSAPMRFINKYDFRGEEMYIKDVVRVSYSGTIPGIDESKPLNISGSFVGVIVEADFGLDVEQNLEGQKNCLMTQLKNIDVKEMTWEVLGHVYEMKFDRPQEKWITNS